MLKGILKVIDKSQMERLHEGVLNVLETTGLLIRGKFLLEALADAGCKVDFDKMRAWFPPEVVEKQIAAQRDRYKMVRSSLWYPFCREMPQNDVCWPDEFCVDFGYAAPWIYDYPSGNYRKPTSQDQVDMIKLGNALEEAKAINAPYICSDFDSKVEIIESSRLLLLNTKKPGWVGTSCGAEVKYLAEFAKLATGDDHDALSLAPPIFVTAYCTTSPLKIDTRSCEVLEEALRHKFPVNFASMPILGATTPVSPAGSVIVAAAEILGGITAVSLIDPEVRHFGASISGEMDMKTTQVCYGTPAAILTDAVLHQLLRYKYGLVHNVEAGYVEGKCPGMQAAFLKTYRQMAFGCTVSSSLPIGALDNASVFSPTQAMLDLDFNRSMYMFAQGIEVDDETMCLDLINELEFCEGRTYLESDHTLQHYRELLWDSKYLDRTYREETSLKPAEHDARILEKADREWRRLVESQEPVEREQQFVAEVDGIVAAAREELLGL